jgi:3-methyladenine DNA glycosylase AlkD
VTKPAVADALAVAQARAIERALRADVPPDRKAIGWVLRETGKKNPGLVIAWLAPRAHLASGVTMREAVKYLPAADSAALTAAYHERVAGHQG